MLRKILSSDSFIILILILLVFISRIVVLDGKFVGYGWDPGNFALAVEDYSIHNTRPHLPGYYLHIKIISIFSTIFKNSFTTMIFLSVLYTCLSIPLLYIMLRKWYRRSISILISLVIYSNPFSWFYGITSQIYAFDLFFSILLVFFCLSPRLVVYSSIILAIGTGIRPTSGILLAPVYCYMWYYHFKSNAISIYIVVISQCLGVLGFLFWFVPMINSAGGLTAYIQLYRALNPTNGLSLATNIFEFSSYMMYLFPTIFLFILGVFLSKRSYFESSISTNPIPYPYINLLYYWLIPSSLCFIFLRYSKGYILLNIVAIVLLLTSIIKKLRVINFVLISIIFVQICVFLFIPYRIPDIQVYFKRHNRNLSLSKVWFDRTLSRYSITRSKITALYDCFVVIDSTISKLPNSFESSYVLIDPTCIVSARALQAKYPDIGFTKLIPLQKEVRYGLLKGVDIENEDDTITMLENSVIMARTDLLDKYLVDINADYLVKNKIWSSFRVSKSDAIQYINFWLKALKPIPDY